ncbi:GreA/GreB family elongation factor [Chloroflexota bacterium]
MSMGSDTLSLGEAASRFLADLPSGERGSSQQEVNKFVRWFGRERPFAGLTAAGLDKYAKQLSLSDTDYMVKLELIRAFLVYAKKKGWSKTNLAIHLKAGKGKSRLKISSRRNLPETIFLTKQGYAELEAELATLQSKRAESIDEVRRAAADKDFRENAPLEAAREQRGLLEGRIMELEEAVKVAVIIDGEEREALRVGIGDSIILLDLDSGEELRYTLVSPREVDPTRGKISSVSPIGRAVMAKSEGEIVEVAVPAGKLRYRVKQVGH